MRRYGQWGLRLLALLWPMAAVARPVAFPESHMLMAEAGAFGQESEYVYSVTARDGFGVRLDHDPRENTQLILASYSRLLWRHNAPRSQANAYLRTGLGAAHQEAHTAAAGQIGAVVDWEDRDYMLSYSNQYRWAVRGVYGMFDQRMRAGVAPYRAAYEDWQPWLLLQLDHQPEHPDALELSPVLRVFKGAPLLGEIGMSLRGRVFATAIWVF